MFRLIRCLLGIAIVALAAVFFYPAYYHPLVSHVPELGLFLPPPGEQATHVTVLPPLTEVQPPATPAPTLAPASAAPAPVTTPAPLVVTVAPPPPGPAVPWSSGDCTWAITTMAYDQHLDQHEAWLIAEGFDSRFPASAIAAYEHWEFAWMAVGSDLRLMCGSHLASNPASIAQDRGNFALAIAAHQADMAANPANTAWDSTWVATYQRLDAMYAALR